MASAERAPRRFWSLVVGIVGLDVITKVWAVKALVPMYTPHPVIGDWVRFTLLYNPGAAFGLHLGAASRWIFMALTVVATVILVRMYRQTAASDTVRLTSIAMVLGGALGNLIDRVRSDAGVVDFIDIGVGAMRWPTFNIADIGVSCGAVLLALVLWREDREAARINSASEAASRA
jgi:signal peptidase II